jgi:DNA primase
LRIPPEKIDEVRNATDIVETIGAYVRLKKRGKNFVGLCPFHAEKTPSFNVSPERQMYHCFGCGVGGNVITFVMEHEKVSFVEAVRTLADRAGISLPTSSSPEDEAVASEQEQLYSVCKLAAQFYRSCMTDTVEGQLALEYFRHRGFSDEIVRTFGLGYAPGTWDALINHARTHGVADSHLEKAGLARRREDGTLYDYFRGRAMFPIFSATGRVIAFGARKMLEDDPLGKYINSPETLIYNKSRVLYGLFQSKEAIREIDSAILVEGYADLISVYQSGVRNVVASSGTALTQEQVRLVSRYSKNLTIVYDADPAGMQAAQRGIEIALANDVDVRVVSLPEGHDPDSFVKAKGADAFRGLIEKAVSFIDFVAQSYERAGRLDTPEGQAHAVRQLVSTIAKMPDELKRNFYVKHIAEKYRLYESTLYRELEKHLGQERRQRGAETNRQDSYDLDRPLSESQAAEPEVPTAERDLIHAMLDGGEEIVRLVQGQMTVEGFSHPAARAVFALLLDRIDEGESITASSLVDAIESEEQRRIVADVMFSKYQLSKGWDDRPIETADARTIAVAAIKSLRKHAISRLVEENQERLKDASRRGEDVTKFLEQHLALLAEMKELG